jgi:hypothetical protein
MLYNVYFTLISILYSGRQNQWQTSHIQNPCLPYRSNSPGTAPSSSSC